QLCTGIADGGCAGISDQRHVLARTERSEDRASGPRPRMRVRGQQAWMGTEVGKELSAVSSVFSDHHRHATERFGGSRGQVAEVAERSGNDVECPARHSI